MCIIYSFYGLYKSVDGDMEKLDMAMFNMSFENFFKIRFSMLCGFFFVVSGILLACSPSFS